MASIYDLKSSFQKLLRPFSNWLARLGVTANQVTIAALLISLLTGIAITCFPTSRWPFILVPIVLFIRMVLNAIDGMLAREHDMQTDLGMFLNELGDVFSDTFIYLPFALVPSISPILIVSIVILSIISEMTGVVAAQVGDKRRYDGPMGKSDRALVFGLIGLLIACNVNLILWINVVLLLVILLLIMTIVNRTRGALHEQKS